MSEQLVIRGVPARIEQDAWWFIDDMAEDGASPGAGPGATRINGAKLPPKALAALAALIILGDLMFWDMELGISVAIYAMALSVCMLALKPGGVSKREAAIAIGLIALCSAPVVEAVQPLSLLFCGAGVIGLLLWIAEGASPKISQVVKTVFEVSFIGPFSLPLEAAADLRHVASGVNVRSIMRTMALPLGIGLLFLVLFTVANPLVGNALSHVTLIDPLSSERLSRAVFWIAGACFLWPYLHSQAPWRTVTHTPLKLSLPTTGLINPASVRTSLILFNLMFALQTFSDIGVLTGGVTLPEGMTYASYAHRGAYPLLATALLSGLFAMATHRLVAKNTFLRGLMYLWLGQTLFLVLTAAVRLDLYVEAYSLTHLRVAVFIWMALIFTGLVLIIVQMVQERSFGWLFKANLITLTGTLYLCCFINFSYLITTYNMAHAQDIALDLAYLCSLGEQVIPAMMDYGQITDTTACGQGPYPSIRFDPIEHWQEWGFRRWRLQRYLQTYHDL